MGLQLPGQEGGEGGEPQPLNLESCLDCCLGSHRAVSLFLPFLFPSQVLGMELGGLDSALRTGLGWSDITTSRALLICFAQSPQVRSLGPHIVPLSTTRVILEHSQE